MSAVEIAAVITSLGGLNAVAAVITALRNKKDRVDPDGPVQRERDSPPPGIPSYGLRDGASWSVYLGLAACLLAFVLVVLVGPTAMAKDAGWITALKWSVIGVAVTAVLIGGWSRYRPGKPGRALVALRVGAGLLAACGAVGAVLITGVVG